jgi:hypothetical protein
MESFFRAALPNLDSDKLVEVVQHLQENGCSTYEDLQFMDCEQDLGALLRPFDVRKVKAKKMEMFTVNTQCKTLNIIHCDKPLQYSIYR